MQIKFNKSQRKEKIKYIVIHDTGNPSEGADAMAHFNYFNSADRQASADFFVDDKQALQVNDYYTYYTWHCGDGKGKSCVTNQNSIGVEICINKGADYEKAKENTAELVKKLMKELDIDTDRVVRHKDVSGKNCPASFTYDDWVYFKRKLLVEITDIDEIVDGLVKRGVVNDSNGLKQEMKSNPDSRLYWLSRKLLQKLREEETR